MEKDIPSSLPDLPTHRMVPSELVGMPTKTKVISSSVEGNLSFADVPLHRNHLSKEAKQIINPVQVQKSIFGDAQTLDFHGLRSYSFPMVSSAT